jgi:hypothetical protein
MIFFKKICGLRYGFYYAQSSVNLQMLSIPTPIRDLQVTRIGGLLELL